ncbi:MAG TPA: type II secretion system protein [Candidatus Saccharimonadales bacterium]|nr:type II secretion system protein [Candidatus Saccharimonadales bacterium]
MKKSESGFALIGLVVVACILIGLFLIVFYTSGTNGRAQSANNQRRVDVNALFNAVEQYRQNHNGTLPDGITDKPKIISSTLSDGAVNLCQALAPYLSTIPIDPVGGLAVPSNAPCTQQGMRYNSGYTIRITQSKQVVVEAPSAENGANIFAGVKEP